MSSLPGPTSPAVSRLTGEFLDRDLERRFRIAALANWQSRLRANVIASALAFASLGLLDYYVHCPSPTFDGLLAVRIAFLALASWLLVARFVPDRVRQYDRCTVIFGYAVGAAFCAVIGIGRYDVMTGGVIMVVIITQLYQFVPTRPILMVATAFPSTLAFLAVALGAGQIGPIEQTALAVTLVIFNAAGAASALRVAHLQRQRFQTREAQTRMLERLTAQSLELAAARDEANHANRAKSEFLAHMSHELRTPLNAINGFSEIIKGEMFGPVAPRYRDYAADIYRSGMHLTALINDILDLSKVEAGKLEIDEAVVEPAEIVEASLRLVRDRAHKADVTLGTDMARERPLLRADERLTKQMLINLLTNAVKFTPRGGQVTVAVRRPADGTLVFEVRDTGIGIAADDIPRVLQPYGQVAAARDRNPDGTGLGLPLVKRMIELHGGTLALDSTPGLGTTATLTFPAARIVERVAPAKAVLLAKAG